MYLLIEEVKDYCRWNEHRRAYPGKLTGFRYLSYFVIWIYEFLKANMRGSTQLHNTGPSFQLLVHKSHI